MRAGLVAACDDPQLFRVPLTTDQRERLAAVEAGPRTHVWCIGRRGLKTTTAAYVGLWCCLLRPELRERLRPGERGYAVGVATNLRQARLLVQSALAVVARSPLLAPLIESVSEDELRFANGTAFAAFPCTIRGGRGWPIFALLCDEFAHVLDNEGNVAAESVLRALLPSTATFGSEARVVVSSTPWGSSGAFAELYEKAASGELPDAMTHRATTAQANPSVPPEFLAVEERRDPEGFRAEYLAEFVGSGERSWTPRMSPRASPWRATWSRATHSTGSRASTPRSAPTRSDSSSWGATRATGGGCSSGGCDRGSRHGAARRPSHWRHPARSKMRCWPRSRRCFATSTRAVSPTSTARRASPSDYVDTAAASAPSR